VKDTILLALVIYAVGCIVPTPLDAQATQETNFSPRFYWPLVAPPFGMVTHTTTDPAWTWHLEAIDENTNQNLIATIFSYDPSTHRYNEMTTVPMAPQQSDDPMLQGLRSGDSMDRRNDCISFGAGTTKLVYAFVSDKSINNDNPEASPDADSNHWELICN
jgi:hypothetical protein